MKPLFSAILVFVVFHTVNAQEIIEDKVERTDSIKPFSPYKVDGVAAVIGDYIILDSDVDMEFAQLKAQGVSTENITRCELFGTLLESKLLLHNAVIDSITVSDAEIRARIDQQIESFLQSTNGSMEKLLATYNKEDEQSLKEEMFEINKNGQLAQKMQQKILEEVEITPEEVRKFFSEIPKDERPTFGTELKVAQIVIEPKATEEEKQRVIQKLRKIREDVIDNGANFNAKVVLHSDDPGSRGKGGKYTLNRKRPLMVKEFREAAFSLQEGEISEPFETDFGYHLVLLEKIRGQEYDVRHILIIPEVSSLAIKEAKELAIKIKQRIEAGEITFADAAREFSDEKETRSEGGNLINPTTLDYNFELTKIEPELYSQIEKLKDNEISDVITEAGRTGNLKFKLVTVTDRINEHVADYSRDYLKIKEQALNKKKLEAIRKWQEEKIMNTFIKINGDNRTCDFSNNWLKK